MNRDAQPPPTPPGDREIEAFLAGNSFQAPPPEWREEILARALAHAPAPTGALPWLHLLRQWLRNVAGNGWGIVAAAWVLILTLNLFATHSIRPSAQLSPPLSAAALAELRAQQRALADPMNYFVNSPEATTPPKAEPHWSPTPGRPRAETAKPLVPPGQALRTRKTLALCVSPSPCLRVSASPRLLPGYPPLVASSTPSAPTPPPRFA